MPKQKPIPTPEEQLAAAMSVLVRALTPIITEEVKRTLVVSDAEEKRRAEIAARSLDWSPSQGDYLMLPKEVAVLLSVPVTTLSSWRYQGQGPKWQRLGASRVAYRRSEIEKWLKAEEAKPLWT